MINIILIIVNLVVFALAVLFLRNLAKKYVKFPTRVMYALLIGVVLGILLKVTYPNGPDIINESLRWISIVGSGYVALLKMIVMPLIVVSIACAILNLKNDEGIAKTSLRVIAILVITTAIAAAIGIAISVAFNLEAPQFQNEATEARQVYLANQAGTGQQTIPDQILKMFPANPFYDLSGQRATSTIAVVILSAFFAIATRQIRKKKEASFLLVQNIFNAFHDVVMRVVTIILRLTPYGVMALIVKMIAGSNWMEIFQLLKFVLASYIALLIMFAVHLVIIGSQGMNPFIFLKKAWPLLLTSFMSRSSAGVISLNTKTQTKLLGVEEGTANISAGLGVAIGQNGCAGIYPAMLAVMSFAAMGIPMDALTILKLIVVIAISSFGVAGVGGGATFAAIIVLSIMDLPVTIAGLLIAIEPLIDMGRTALNVSDTLVAGMLTSKMNGTFDKKTYTDMDLALDSDEM